MEFLLYSFLLLLPLFPLYFLIKFKSSRNDGLLPPPGPAKLPIIGNLHQLGKRPPHQELRRLSQKYGPVMLLQLGSIPTLVISSAEAAKQVLKTHDLDFCTRPPLAGMKRLSYNYLDVIFAPYGEYWREIRKICVLELLSAKRVQSFKVIREEEIASVIYSISASAPSASVDVFEMFARFTNRTLCRVAFGGMKFDDGKLKETLDEITSLMSGFSASDIFPRVGWIIDRLTGMHGRLEKCCHDLDKYFQDIVDEHLNRQERLKSSEHEYDLIDVLLKLEKDLTSPIRIINDHIKAILMNVFLAGVDASAVTMNWAMAELIKNPAAMKKVQGEVRSYNVGRNTDKVEEKDLDHLQYLKMVVRETLRLHSPLPMLLPRESMNNCKIDGYDIKPKTRVLVNAWAIGRNPAYWYKPDEFNPERFIDKYSNSTDYGGQQDFEYLPFGGGRRGCPGINMGLVTTELALANMLYCFDWALPAGMKIEDVSMDESSGMVVHKKDHLQLVPIKKKNL
ncbi:cytochrome P450 71B10-like [Papaver somniferum]|uniref:cytochrome P450 71B10-like n=1 Tax=Papaver somniferum TaxID=3469 RepID=UPI000E7042E0|nr:cytochrome P450 71B10-like [Papaver somniferum]